MAEGLAPDICKEICNKASFCFQKIASTFHEHARDADRQAVCARGRRARTFHFASTSPPRLALPLGQQSRKKTVSVLP